MSRGVKGGFFSRIRKVTPRNKAGRGANGFEPKKGDSPVGVQCPFFGELV
jgi:hypothetical protein